MTLLLYALADRPISIGRVRGMEREPLRRITVGKVTAVVGLVRRHPNVTSARLRRYDAIVRTLAERTPAILPARFATTMTDVAEIEHVLRERQPSLVRALAHVRRRAQMTIRLTITAPPTSVARAMPSHRATAPESPSSGAAYLRQRAAEIVQSRHVPGFDDMRASLQRFIRDERVEKRGAVATVYHLIPRASAVAYRRALDIAARQSGLRVIVSGPWPPYAFAQP